MKNLGPWFLISVLCWSAAAQEKPKTIPQNSGPTTSAKSANDNRLKLADLERNATTSDNSYCAYIRAYRVKREARGSDIVRPAGYTTCVPSTRFTMKSVVQTTTTDPPAAEKEFVNAESVFGRL